ncbi:hypothetical protein JKF63_03128 [Porcisia hertigi]|uniref:EF-hand domain-containing protein n=1 Tax=Porcisia hertigi TaxID=2761500 RepID=A0A836HTH0_9TRYP|nr:hypothetical protein JKF63_03128 [Porcisia hertigi]
MSLSGAPGDVADCTVDPQVAAIFRLLAPEEVDMLRDTFIYMDHNSDGYVSREEMMAQVAACVGPERFPPLQEYLLPLFEVADKDRDGRLSLTEFLMAFADGPGVVPAEVVNRCVAGVRVRLTDEEISALQSSFRRIDTNQDGVLDAEELEVALREHLLATFPDLTQENFKEIVAVVMASADTDKDGVLSLSEFIRSYQEDQGVLPATFLESTQPRQASARQLTDDEVTVLQEAFAVLDRNDDGFIDLEDLYHALWDTLGSSTEDHTQVRDLCNLIMLTADRSKRGQLTVTDFLQSFLRNVQLMQIPISVAHERVRVACEKLQEMHDSGELERLVLLFKDLDSDGDGIRVRSELVSMLKALFHDVFPGWDEGMLTTIMTAIVLGAETNNCGKLTLEEFIRSFVEGPGLLSPGAVKTSNSSAAPGSTSSCDSAKQPRTRLVTATDADLTRIGEALGCLYVKKGTDGTFTEDELHISIAQLYKDDPGRGEDMFHFALQHFVVRREDGCLIWSSSVHFEDVAEEESNREGVVAGSGNGDDSAERASSTRTCCRTRVPVTASPVEVLEPRVCKSPQEGEVLTSSSLNPQSLPSAADAGEQTVATQSEGDGGNAVFYAQKHPKLRYAALAASSGPAAAQSREAKKLFRLHELYSLNPSRVVLEDELRRQFNHYDVEHKGYLDREAFKKVYMNMENYGLDPSPMEVDMRFSRYSNRSDKIFFNEFCILMLQRARL